MELAAVGFETFIQLIVLKMKQNTVLNFFFHLFFQMLFYRNVIYSLYVRMKSQIKICSTIVEKPKFKENSKCTPCVPPPGENEGIAPACLLYLRIRAIKMAN